jgi:hypothetical protein
MKHQGQANRAARAQLQGRLSVDVEDVERRRLFKADFALEVPLTHDQRRALYDAAQNRKEPAGRVLARVMAAPDPETGKDIEVLTGWDTLNAHIEENAYARWVQISLIDASDEDAVFYAIQHAYEEAKIAGYPVTAIDYAEAVERARQRFANSIPTLTRMATALRIGRPTLANRLALLDKLCPQLIHLTRTGQIPETAAKAIASTPDEQEQMRYAEAYLKDPMPIAALYALMQSGLAVKEGRAEPHGEEVQELHPGEQVFVASIEKAVGVPAVLVQTGDSEGRPELRLRYESVEDLADITVKLTQLMAGAPDLQGELVLNPETVAWLLATTAPD